MNKKVFVDIYLFIFRSQTSSVLANFQGQEYPWPVFTKGLRLSQVLGLNPVLKLRLLSQLSFVSKPYSQKVT